MQNVTYCNFVSSDLLTDMALTLCKLEQVSVDPFL
jgi:hypothetical protein